MKARVLVTSAVAFSAAASWCLAYNIDSFTYEEMFAKSDLVVIARPSESRDTRERTLDRNVKPPVAVAGVVTRCDALYVLKGPKLKEFALHHFRDVSHRDPNYMIVGGRIGIAFDQSKGTRCYLMFLVRESNGRYAPFDGQTDVEGLSIQEISGTSAD